MRILYPFWSLIKASTFLWYKLKDLWHFTHSVGQFLTNCLLSNQHIILNILCLKTSQFDIKIDRIFSNRIWPLKAPYYVTYDQNIFTPNCWKYYLKIETRNGSQLWFQFGVYALPSFHTLYLEYLYLSCKNELYGFHNLEDGCWTNYPLQTPKTHKIMRQKMTSSTRIIPKGSHRCRSDNFI